MARSARKYVSFFYLKERISKENFNQLDTPTQINALQIHLSNIYTVEQCLDSRRYSSLNTPQIAFKCAC